MEGANRPGSLRLGLFYALLRVKIVFGARSAKSGKKIIFCLD